MPKQPKVLTLEAATIRSIIKRSEQHIRRLQTQRRSLARDISLLRATQNEMKEMLRGS